jgi:hypothetical protein
MRSDVGWRGLAARVKPRAAFLVFVLKNINGVIFYH